MLAPTTLPDLPQSLRAAIWRGVKGQCPRCGTAGLFTKFLRPVGHCPACHQDWSLHQADDFPPYVSIFLTGHLLAPVMIMIGGSAALSMGAKIGIAMVLATGLMLSFLQPAKGGVIALQWWMGMHRFAPGGKIEALAPPKGEPGSPWA